MSALEDADPAPLQPGDADDLDEDDDPGPGDDGDDGDDEDDDEDDEEPRERDAATSAPRDAGMRDAMSPPPDDDEGADDDDDDPAPVVDAGVPPGRDASDPPARDAASEPVVDASMPRDASTPADAGPSMPPVVACSAGTYRGTISGTIRGGGDVRVTGTVTFVLGATGTSLRVQSGTFEGRDQQGQTLTARLSGVLNCATDRFESGALQDGVYDTRVGLVSPVRFEGGLGGLRNESTGVVAGEWRWESALGSREGSGTWTAMRAP